MDYRGKFAAFESVIREKIDVRERMVESVRTGFFYTIVHNHPLDLTLVGAYSP